ncbi:MAG: ABC transporter permease [Treponema sp.]
MEKVNKTKIFFNKIRDLLQKPQNVILLIFGILLSFSTIAPVVTILADTISVHSGTIDQHLSGKASGFTLVNWIDLFTSSLAQKNLWHPLANSMILAVFSCAGAIIVGGIFAFLITRTNMKYKRYLSAIFIFPYIMPQWTLALVWRNMFRNTQAVGGADGLLASLFHIYMPAWWIEGMFPSIIVLALHYSAFAYILIGGIFKNMDSNLEEAATILNTKKSKIFFRITLPLLTPAILSTILLVFGSSMGSYPVPHYLKLTTLSTKYVDLKVNYAGEASIIGVLMMIFGVLILLANQVSTKSRKSYTTVTGKSGQVSKVNLGRVGKYIIPIVLIVLTFFTSIYPIISFAFETFLPNPGDYSFFTTGNVANLTTKWWMHRGTTDVGLYGQYGMLFNKGIWNSFRGTIIVAVFCSLLAGTIGLLIGYAVSKNRRNRFANYVNDIAFLPYLLPSIAVGIAFFIFGSLFGLYDTFLLAIIAATVKYIPFASRSSLNSMMQISGEIEESALIAGTPWYKRMIRIIIPIQKSAIISGFLLPFMTCIRELPLFMLLVNQDRLMTTKMDYYDEMGLFAFSSGMNLIIIVFILLLNFSVNKLTNSGIDKGLGGK